MSKEEDRRVLNALFNLVIEHATDLSYWQDDMKRLLREMWESHVSAERIQESPVTQSSDPMNITTSLAGIVNDKNADIHARIRAAELLIGLMEISDE